MQRVRAKRDIDPIQMSATDIAELVNFMKALTGKSTEHLPLGIPSAVPSGLPID